MTLAPKSVLAHEGPEKWIGYLLELFRFQACVMCSRRGGRSLTGWAKPLALWTPHPVERGKGQLINLRPSEK